MVKRIPFVSRIFCGVSLLFLAFFSSLALITFCPSDPSYFVDVASREVPLFQTIGGWWGASLADFLLRFFGETSYLVILIFAGLGLWFLRVFWFDFGRVIGLFFIWASALIFGGSFYSDTTLAGFLGQKINKLVAHHVDGELLWLCAGGFAFVGFLILFRFFWLGAFLHVCKIVGQKTYLDRFIFTVGKTARKAFAAITVQIKGLKESLFPTHRYQDDDFWDTQHELPESTSALIPQSVIELSAPVDEELIPEYELPRDRLYKKQSSVVSGDRQIPSEARVAARGLETKLRQFGIEGAVSAIHAGPTVTLFLYTPATDVKVSRIVALEDDLALALEARSLRVIAPMPGTSCVGFEVANKTGEPVLFEDIISGPIFSECGAQIPLVLGKSVTGDDRVVDLAQQPHLLVAGSTGSGKSVALHTMISGILASKTPDEVKLVLIDPKRLEFIGYTHVPHLFVPIVNDGAQTCRILRYLAEHMEERYQRMAAEGVRNIQEYHHMRGTLEMPYIVVVIDELADLMMVVGREIEAPLIRLAQMARAAGIHLIVATQRPSVDVLTGLVKVNFPARIAFKVASKTDARTILDQSGAEKLLGRGDLLFLDSRGVIERMQGAFIKNEEITSIVQCIKEQRTTDYLTIPDESIISAGASQADDPLYPEVLAFVRTIEEVSISLIQRRFRIGYNRSARLVDVLEERGVVSASQGSKMRRVVRDSSLS